jgi:hypothetical protein
MMGATIRLLSAYIAFALTMCLTAALLLAVFSYKPKDFFIDFKFSFLLAAAMVKLHAFRRTEEATIAGWTLRSEVGCAGYLCLSRCLPNASNPGCLDGTPIFAR